jgi:hypothetical protein
MYFELGSLFGSLCLFAPIIIFVAAGAISLVVCEFVERWEKRRDDKDDNC